MHSGILMAFRLDSLTMSQKLKAPSFVIAPSCSRRSWLVCTARPCPTRSCLWQLNSMPIQVYALATGLCVASSKANQASRTRNRDEANGDGDEASEDAASPADAVEESVEAGRSFGRLVVDGCCQQFAQALKTVRGFEQGSVPPPASNTCPCGQAMC